MVLRLTCTGALTYEAAKPMEMSRTQSFALLGIFGVLVVGVGLPLGLVAVMLESSSAGSIRGAVDHGELFLAAANAAIGGCVALIGSRRDNVLSRAIATLFVFAAVVFPCYAAWAAVTTHISLGLDYSEQFVVTGGCVAVVAAVVIALAMVAASYHAGFHKEI